MKQNIICKKWLFIGILLLTAFKAIKKATGTVTRINQWLLFYLFI